MAGLGWNEGFDAGQRLEQAAHAHCFEHRFE
jgi:hypothetical protein